MFKQNKTDLADSIIFYEDKSILLLYVFRLTLSQFH